MLSVHQIYIYSRFKTSDSKPHSYFTIELPRTLNTPDATLAYINDTVLPVSWTTTDEQHNML